MRSRGNFFPELRNFWPTKRLNRIDIPKSLGCHAGSGIPSPLVHLELKRRQRNWIQVSVSHCDPCLLRRLEFNDTISSPCWTVEKIKLKVSVDSSHRTEMWGAPKFIRALFLFWFKRREMSAKWFRTDCSQSFRSCGSWITFAALRFLLPICNFWGVLLTPFETLVAFNAPRALLSHRRKAWSTIGQPLQDLYDLPFMAANCLPHSPRLSYKFS